MSLSDSLGNLYAALMFFLIVTPLALVSMAVAVFWHGRDLGRRFMMPPSPSQKVRDHPRL